jgi:hypothetical protein
MPPFLIATLRTLVPAAWGTLLAWAVGRGLLTQAFADEAGPLAEGVLIPLCIALYYIVMHWLEAQTWMPAPLVTLLLGSSSAPSYGRHAAPDA